MKKGYISQPIPISREPILNSKKFQRNLMKIFGQPNDSLSCEVKGPGALITNETYFRALLNMKKGLDWIIERILTSLDQDFVLFRPTSAEPLIFPAIMTYYDEKRLNLLFNPIAQWVDMEVLENKNHVSLMLFDSLGAVQEINGLQSASSRVITHRHALSAWFFELPCPPIELLGGLHADFTQGSTLQD